MVTRGSDITPPLHDKTSEWRGKKFIWEGFQKNSNYSLLVDTGGGWGPQRWIMDNVDNANSIK